MIDIIYRIGHFLLITMFAMALGLLFMGIARKIVARIQKRYGPPIYQPYLDVLKLFGKNAITHGFIFDFGAIMALGGVIATLFFIPLGSWQLYSMEGTVILVIYLLAIASLGMAMGTVGSGNPQASVGISRALMQMLGYELPYLVILFALIFRYKTSSVWGLMQAQAGSFQNWNLFAYPLGLLRADVSLLGNPHHGIAHGLTELSEKDVLVVIGAAPYTRGTVAAARIAANRGMQVVAITDSHGSPLATEASLTFVAPTSGTWYSNSMAAFLVFVEGLMAMVAGRLGRKSLNSLRRHELLIDEVNHEL
jgi:hypothetical protein